MSVRSGPLVLAYLLHWGLLGTLSVQIFNNQDHMADLYYLAFPNDRRTVKCIVYSIFTTEVVQSILVTRDAFAIYGYGFGNFNSLTDMHLDWLTVPVMSGIVAFAGQTFYAYRISILSNSKAVPVLILLSSKTSIAVGIWCGTAALGDIVIAVCMTYYLSHRDSGFSRTHSIITKYIRLTIETGSITACLEAVGDVWVAGKERAGIARLANVIVKWNQLFGLKSFHKQLRFKPLILIMK
ncbi:hypothetical protein BDP27DRAFT_1368762 [Rhodocollybia butyracea]|uniref:DUF6534 domain-containing protein n=1 Tax=Rhodocollybia butyracea TaxID=206335 RepID=A0A9P5U1J8_9AGAR|nr:hypothetical protein BDP27DRAFT_1368762 [Rhodocollybia butyracea]